MRMLGDLLGPRGQRAVFLEQLSELGALLLEVRWQLASIRSLKETAQLGPLLLLGSSHGFNHLLAMTSFGFLFQLVIPPATCVEETFCRRPMSLALCLGERKWAS